MSQEQRLSETMMKIGHYGHAASLGDTEEAERLFEELRAELATQPEQAAEKAGLVSANGRLSTLLNESTQMLAQLRAMVDALHDQWCNGGRPERGEFSLLDRVDDWLNARPSEMFDPQRAAPAQPEQANGGEEWETSPKDGEQWETSPKGGEPMTDAQREWFMKGYDASQQDALVCQLPPLGWHCTRKAGHEGPCAAVKNDDAELVQRGMDRLRESTHPAPAASVSDERESFPPMPEGWPARFRCDSCDGSGEVGDLVRMGDFEPIIHSLTA